MVQLARPNTLSHWLHWLEAMIPENKIELGLERIQRVADAMGLRVLAPFVITVTGTNGKGSTLALLEAILLAAGYTVGVMSSPHLVRFNERVRLNGVDANDQLLCSAFSAINEGRCGSQLSYFEFITLVAAHCFKQETLDVVILEVGMGGRLDAVNVFDCDIAVITTIGLDHQEYLGNSLEAIGREKAGIMRMGKPVVFGDHWMPASIREYSNKLGAELFQRGNEFDVLEQNADWRWCGLSASGERLIIDKLPIPKLELDNAATALQALKLMPEPIKVEAVANGIARARLSGRGQKLQWRNEAGLLINVILDVSHNPQAVERLTALLEKDPCVGKTYAILAMCKDKDYDRVIGLLEPQVQSWTATTFDSSRALTARELSVAIEGRTTAEVFVSNDIAAGFTDTVNKALPDDRVLVIGSFRVVAAILALFGG